jgi:hypothetical protein
LEDRHLLSFTASYDAATATLTLGSIGGHDFLTLVNNGNGHILVSTAQAVNGVVTETATLDDPGGGPGFFNVKKVEIVTRWSVVPNLLRHLNPASTARNGPDLINFLQRGDNFNPSGDQIAPLQVNANLGDPIDFFNADLQGHAIRGGALDLFIFGNNAFFSIVNIKALGVDISGGGRLNVFYQGNPGGNFDMAWSGVKEPGGKLFAHAFGGQRARLNLTAAFAGFYPNAEGPAPDSLGLAGGAGDDDLRMTITGPTLDLWSGSPLHQPVGRVDGGGGDNFCDVTPPQPNGFRGIYAGLITVLNCQHPGQRGLALKRAH